MKKFLIFLVAIVVVVCVGLTTYYFLRNDEVISFSTLEVYCNVGDRLYINKDLGYSVTKQDDSTTYDFNAGGDEVISIIAYDEENGYYEAKTGGDTTIVITTSNKNYPEFKISVHVGDGDAESPYYISKISQLAAIGDGYSLSGYYSLTSDIALTSDFTAIGYDASGTDLGFSGNFDGNGHVISGLNLNGEATNAGLFTKLNSGASVTDLIITGASINGSYSNAGVLAGSASGATIARVQVLSSNITNTNTAGVTGGLVGEATSSKISVSYVSGTTLTVGSSDAASTVEVGGFVGKLNLSTITATYADTTINTVGTVGGDVAGFVGLFTVDTNNGTIQQSYSVVSTSTEDINLGLFLGTISGSITIGEDSKLRYLVGNYTVGDNAKYSIVNTVSINDGNDYFNDIFTDSSWVDATEGYYLICCVADMTTFSNMTNYIYYQISSESITAWDTTAWSNTTVAGRPTLNMTEATLAGVSSEYLLRELTQQTVSESQNWFKKYSGQTLNNANFKLDSDITLTAAEYSPIYLTNSIVDGNNYTITIYVENTATISNSTYAGLFSIVDGCTIKNLNIVVKSYTVGATYAGALAGQITSTSTAYSSSIENVTVTYDAVTLNGTYTNLGGFAGEISNTNIKGCTVTGFTASTVTATNVGGFVGSTSSATFASLNGTKNSVATTLISASASNLGGFVGVNDNSTIADLTINDLTIIANSTGNVGGIVGTNSGSISNATAGVTMTINASSVNAGGVAGQNNSTISAVTLSSGSIVVANAVTSVNLGGVAGVNSASASIANAYVYLTTIGFRSGVTSTDIASSSLTLGGIVAQNSGAINACLVTSDMYGNYVGGVVAVMNNVSTAKVTNVLVGKFNTTNGTITQNTLAADKYVAGIVYDFEANGVMTDIQVESKITGLSNDTACSLMTIIFKYGSELSYATVNSTFDGYGTRYLEAQYTYGKTNEYNIYYENYSGTMTNVVINSDVIGSYDQSSRFIATTYVLGNTLSYNGVNYHLLVSASEFATSSTYSGEKSINTGLNYGFFYTQTSVSVTIDMGSRATWATDSVNSDSAYRLSFLLSLIG